jgi:hypothetical protein
MASGHVNRASRPNTWLHRPSCKREENPCQRGAVHTWKEGVRLGLVIGGPRALLANSPSRLPQISRTAATPCGAMLSWQVIKRIDVLSRPIVGSGNRESPELCSILQGSKSSSPSPERGREQISGDSDAQSHQHLGAQLRMLKAQILEFDRQIMAWHRSNETSKRLDEIPGVGPALATALVASALAAGSPL